MLKMLNIDEPELWSYSNWNLHFEFISLNYILFYSKLFDKHPAPDDTYWMP